MNQAPEDAYDLARFTLADMVRCGRALRLLASESETMEEAGQKVTRYLYDHLWDRSRNQTCSVLVRLFKTHPYALLPEEIRAFADSKAGGVVADQDTRCLTLLATAGDAPDWNSRRRSREHQSIPLLSEAIVAQSPMIVQLIRSLGISTAEFLGTRSGILSELEQRKFGVFYVAHASGSPFVPAQKDFVQPYGVASVVGCGGLLPDQELLILIIFSRSEVAAAAAEMFRTIAVNLKLGFLELMDKPVFAG